MISPKKFIKLRSRQATHILVAIVMTVVASGLWVGQTSATQFTQAFIRLDSLSAATNTSGRVCVKPSATNSGASVSSIKVTFPTDSAAYGVNSTAANWTVNTSNLDSGQTAYPNITTATTVSGVSVTFGMTSASSAMTSANLYCFNFSGVNTLTTPTAGATETTPGSITTQTGVPAAIDSTSVSIQANAGGFVTSGSTVTISNAVVPPSFAFTINGTTDSFTANLTVNTVVSTSGRTITIKTNAPNGWIVWVQDLAANANGSGNGSLSSTNASFKFGCGAGCTLNAASHTIAGSTQDYGLGATVTTNGSGSAAIASAYDGTASKIGTLDPGVFLPMASATGVTNSDVLTETESAQAVATTPAATDYGDTITFVGAGRF